MIDYFLIITGFVVLIIAAHFLVEGATGLAKRFNVSNMIIGLTVVAFGTSAPELVVNLVASINPETTDIALTNIIGSNMINIYVILGLSAIIFPIASQSSSRRFEIPLSFFAPVLVLILAATMNHQINHWGAVVLFAVFIWFMYVMIKNSRKKSGLFAEEDFKPIRVWLASLMIIGGLAGLIGGAQLIVPSATNIALSWGVSQSVIGLTIVALGTSLPELATSAVAAFKKNSDIALGNVIGSNIFNVFFILSISAFINPLPAYRNMYADLIITALGSLLVMLFVYSNKSKEIKRWAGVILLVVYTVYLIWMIAATKN